MITTKGSGEDVHVSRVVDLSVDRGSHDASHSPHTNDNGRGDGFFGIGDRVVGLEGQDGGHVAWKQIENGKNDQSFGRVYHWPPAKLTLPSHDGEESTKVFYAILTRVSDQKAADDLY